MTPERLRERRRMRTQRETNERRRDEFVRMNAEFWDRHDAQQDQIRVGVDEALVRIQMPWHDLLAKLGSNR